MKKIKSFILNFYYLIENYLFFKKFESLLKPLNINFIEELKVKHEEAFLKLKNCFNNKNFQDFEADQNFFYDLTWQTQTVKKDGILNFNHGFLLQYYLSDYLKKNYQQGDQINVLEIGTARGYSSICMSKILNDHKINGKIFTMDILPLNKKIFWNSPSDIDGKKTRSELLQKWSDLVSKYLVFIKGYSIVALDKFHITRINFAFIDGSHDFEDVKNEIAYIKVKQEKNDIIFFDDYNKKDFPGVVKAIEEIKNNNTYRINIIDLNQERKYVLAIKNE